MKLCSYGKHLQPHPILKREVIRHKAKITIFEEFMVQKPSHLVIIFRDCLGILQLSRKFFKEFLEVFKISEYSNA